MGVLFNPRNNKEKWASVVMASTTPGISIDEKVLDAATTLYIQQHSRILYESIHLVLTSKKKDTKKSRFKLAEQHLGSLGKVRKYANREQKKAIDQAFTDFKIMEDRYKHPNRDADMKKVAAKKQKKNEFWETYAELEMIDIFFGDDD